MLGQHIFTSSRLSRTVYLIPGVSIGIIIAMALTTMANGPELDTDPRVFPYKGYLEFNGEAFAGNVDLQFTVTDDGDCNFTEEHDSVAVYGGRFSVSIGSVVGDVDPCVFDSARVFIQVGVRNADQEEAYTMLSGRQRIYPVPFAYWAAEGSDFEIDGNANIAGNITVNGQANVGSNLNVTGNTAVSGNTTVSGQTTVDGKLTVDDEISFTGRLNNPGGNILMDDNVDVGGGLNVGSNTSSTLNVNGSATVTGTVQGADLRATDDLFVDDDATITGNVSISGTLSDPNSPLTIFDDMDVQGNTGLNVTNHATIGSDGSGNLTVNGNANISGEIIVNGNLDLTNNIDYNSTTVLNNPARTVGCTRLGEIQHCWGIVSADGDGETHNFKKDFGNLIPVVVVSGFDASNRPFITVSNVNASNFTVRSRTSSGDGVNTEASYFAYGLAGEQW